MGSRLTNDESKDVHYKYRRQVGEGTDKNNYSNVRIGIKLFS